MATTSRLTFRLISGVGIAVLFIAGYLVTRHRTVLKVEGLELGGMLPLHVLVAVAIGTVLTVWGGVGLMGEFRPIARSLDISHEDMTYRPGYLAFGKVNAKIVQGYRPDYLDKLDLLPKDNGPAGGPEARQSSKSTKGS